MPDPVETATTTVADATDGVASATEVDLDAKITAAVQKATEGIKGNRDEILAEKRAAVEERNEFKKIIDALGGAEGAERLSKIKSQLEETELGKLLAEGKHDEWYETKTESMRTAHAKQVEVFGKKTKEAETRAQDAERRYSQMRVAHEFRDAASAAGIQDTAVGDVLLNAHGAQWAWSDELGKAVVLDKATKEPVPGSDGVRPKTPTEWLEELKKEKRHWWPPSQGADLEGGADGVPGIPDAEAVGNMSLDAYRKWRKKQGMSEGSGAHHF